MVTEEVVTIALIEEITLKVPIIKARMLILKTIIMKMAKVISKEDLFAKTMMTIVDFEEDEEIEGKEEVAKSKRGIWIVN